MVSIYTVTTTTTTSITNIVTTKNVSFSYPFAKRLTITPTYLPPKKQSHCIMGVWGISYHCVKVLFVDGLLSLRGVPHSSFNASMISVLFNHVSTTFFVTQTRR